MSVARCAKNVRMMPPEMVDHPGLCGWHWSQYRQDWLLLGWCEDHYGEALSFCAVHRRQIEPL
jgi:hypothetical protein